KITLISLCCSPYACATASTGGHCLCAPATAACAVTILYRRQAQRRHFPQPSLVAVGGHRLAGAATHDNHCHCGLSGAASMRDSRCLYWRVITVCGRAHGRRLCTATACAWMSLCSGADAAGLLFAHSRCNDDEFVELSRLGRTKWREADDDRKMVWYVSLERVAVYLKGNGGVTQPTEEKPRGGGRVRAGYD
ncbi:hypothetical protein BHE74_00044472, partial [Ensete ventricosum]